MQKQLPQGFLINGLSEEAILRWLVLFLAMLIGGAAGLIAVVMAQLMLNIAKGSSTARLGNLGGLVVLAFVWASIVWYEWILQFSILNEITLPIVFASTVFGALGIFEDFQGRLALKNKLIVMVFITIISLVMSPSLLLDVSTFSVANSFAYSSLLAYVFTIALVVFNVNAFNTADGANGLVSGTALLSAVGLIQLGLGLQGGMLALLGLGCAIFLLFNVIVGRIFLGDGGAYFLGAFLSLSAVHVMKNDITSFWYLLCLLFYPHADLLFSMIRRKGAGKAMFGADNGHLHNLIYRKLSSITMLSRHANTMTGLSVACVFGGLPLLMWNLGLKVDWLWIYCFQWFLYAASWGLLADRLTRDVDTKDWATPIKL
jgi:UDP-GlcNAc:undecaprenyl-phosphate/decaprenyl-phosphate GlcNAc-1-phosphate transferase